MAARDTEVTQQENTSGHDTSGSNGAGGVTALSSETVKKEGRLAKKASAAQEN